MAGLAEREAGELVSEGSWEAYAVDAASVGCLWSEYGSSHCSA